MIHVLPTLADAAEAVASRLAGACADAIAARGAFRWALSGGTTPVPLYRLLASPTWRPRLDWPRVRVLFADERAVPPDAPDSNYARVRELLIEPLDLDEAQVPRMKGEATDLDAAAREYECELESPADLVLLGMGADGHVASLFPGGDAVEETARRVVAVMNSPKPPPRRLTVTPRTLGEARARLVLCAGSDKAAAAARALGGRAAPRDCPAVMVADGDWYIDQAAAAGL